MLLYLTLWYKIQEHQVDGLTVQSVELNTLPRTANYPHHVANQIGRGVRNSNAVPDSRAHRGFALYDAHRDCFPVLGLDLVNGHQMVDQLINGPQRSPACRSTGPKSLSKCIVPSVR